MRIHSLSALFLLPLTLTAVPLALADPVEEAIARGDAAWSRRAEGHQGRRAAPGPIGEAIAAYREALEADPANLSTRWRLMRALYFQGEYVTAEEGKLEVYEQGRELGEEGLNQLAALVGGRRELDRLEPEEVGERLAGEPQAASVYFWTAAHWGLWGRHRGKIAAARQGVAGKVRDYAEAVIALDERIENGGGHRVLGRLHAEAPRLPFITGWVDRKRAVSELERAVELAPDDLLSRLYLIEALLEFVPERRGEAMERLRRLVEATPGPDFAVEEAQVIADAKVLLARVGS